ncbi:MAG: NUDIX hydrolase [Chloroflexota bacterium]|nr:NUDIX hydrolase [Chloroflexota bacterium]
MEEQTLATENIYEGRRINLRVDRVVLPSGRETTREIAAYPDSVGIIALDKNDDVVLVRQYRHAVGRVLLEIPAGGIEEGEAPEESALRELKEETGYVAGRVERIGGAYAAPGYATEFLHLFLATELKYGLARAEDDEFIEVVRIPLKDIVGLIESGELCDGKSIIGLLTLLLRRGECGN